MRRSRSWGRRPGCRSADGLRRSDTANTQQRHTLICHNKLPFSKLTACTDPLAACLTAAWYPVYTIQPVVKPVVQPVWRQVVSCKRGLTDPIIKSHFLQFCLSWQPLSRCQTNDFCRPTSSAGFVGGRKVGRRSRPLLRHGRFVVSSWRCRCCGCCVINSEKKVTTTTTYLGEVMDNEKMSLIKWIWIMPMRAVFTPVAHSCRAQANTKCSSVWIYCAICQSMLTDGNFFLQIRTTATKKQCIIPVQVR